MIRILQIKGDSLYPLLKESQRVVCLKVFGFTSVKVGDFVVFYRKPYGLMIKRVKYIQDNRYFVQGTSPQSTDSRDFGFLSFRDLKYKVFFKFPQKN